ncbi:MAG: division/cell wall cluster transcriptional repressor MraZ [Candidatus Eutrophobiaceae bacterium]
MFRGISQTNLDIKGRIAIPSRWREALQVQSEGKVVLTVNPWDPSLLLYSLPEWDRIEAKLLQLDDFNRNSRRTKQMIMGHAADLELDGQGRILVAKELREYAQLEKVCAFMGQGNRFEIWDSAAWQQSRDTWFKSNSVSEEVDKGGASAALASLSL